MLWVPSILAREGRPLVQVVEKASIVEARGQDVLEAGPHGVQVLVAAVAYGDKARHQRAVRRDQGEIALVLAHRRHQNRAWERQILRAERAQNRRRPFRQVDIFFQQLLGDLHLPTGFPGQRVGLRDDHFPALDGVDQHALFANDAEIRGGVRHIGVVWR